MSSPNDASPYAQRPLTRCSFECHAGKRFSGFTPAQRSRVFPTVQHNAESAKNRGATTPLAGHCTDAGARPGVRPTERCRRRNVGLVVHVQPISDDKFTVDQVGRQKMMQPSCEQDRCASQSLSACSSLFAESFPVAEDACHQFLYARLAAVCSTITVLIHMFQNVTERKLKQWLSCRRATSHAGSSKPCESYSSNLAEYRAVNSFPPLTRKIDNVALSSVVA